MKLLKADVDLCGRPPRAVPALEGEGERGQRGYLLDQRAWTTSTAYVAPVEWQVAQASAGAVEPGKYAVLIRACAATSRLSWQPVHAAVAGPCGEKKSRCVTTLSVAPVGTSAVVMLVWHFAQSRRSPGKATLLKFTAPPPWP